MLNSPGIETNSSELGTYTSLNDASGVREKKILGSDLILPTTELGAAISQNLVFIDGAIVSNSNLAQSFSNAQVFTLDPHLDGVAQISDILAHYQNVASVHIVSHGSVADVALGNTHLNLQNLSLYSSNLQSWSHAFNQDTDILFYGCNVGADAEGQSFIQQLSQLTGADIAASNNLTGSSPEGGDWNLEVATGSIESLGVLDKSAIANYDGANLASIDDGLIARWQFDESSGLTATDIIQNNNGTLLNNPQWSAGKVNGSLRFDGVDDYVSVPSNPSLNLSGGTFTQSLWIYSNITNNGYYGVLGYQPVAGNNQRYPGIWVYNQTQIHAGFGDGSNWNSFTTGNVLKTNAWNHIATSFDGTTYKAYVNGQEVYSTTNFAGRKPYATQQLNIGRVDNYFSGQIDDVRIYNRALSAADIASLAQLGTPNPGVISLETNAIAVNEGNGTATVTVLRQQGSDGTVTVDYRTVDNSAIAGADYTGQSGTLTFAPGQTSKSVTIPILDDALTEGNETFGFAIDNITGGATLSAPQTAAITIVDNENSTSTSTGLVGYWKLDETSIGATVVDSSGFNNNGSHVNITSPSGPSTNVPLLTFTDPNSLKFDGVDDYVNISSNPSLNLSSGTFTQSAWLYSNITNNGYYGVLGYQPVAGNNQRYPGIWVYNQTQIHAGFGDGSNWNAFTTGNVLKTNAWNHVATSFDGTTYKAYVNGQEVYSTNDFAGRKPYATQQLNIGRVDNNFSGQIDDVRIYNRALSATDIASLAQIQTPPPPQPSGPGVIGLESSTIAVNEANGTATVTVLRQQGSDGTVTVDYQTVDGSATPGADYIRQSGTLTFAPGETRKSVAIPILDDTLTEGNETFGFAIDNITGGATLLAPRTAQITIVDNENVSGLVGYWKLDESSIGATVVDSSGFNNNGNHVNIASPSGPTTKVPLLNFVDTHSLTFDGIDDYVSIPNSPTLNLSNGTFTQSVWIYSNTTNNGYYGILGYQPAGGNAQRYPGIWLYNQTQIHAGFGDGTNWNSFTTGNVLRLNSWNQVVTSFDGTTYKAYVNGQEVYSTNDFAGRKPYATQQLNIGRVDSGFSGQIDDVRIYNTALSAAEIQQMYQAQPMPDQRQLFTDTMVSGLVQPTAMDWTPAGQLPDGQLMFIAEKSGVVKVFKNGSLLATPFIDISRQVNNVSDRGLIDIAVHPDFVNNPYVYLAFTYDPPEVYQNTGLAGPDQEGNRAGRLIRVTADARTGYTTAIAGSEVVLLGKNSTWNNFNGFVNSTVDFNQPPAGILPNGENLQDFLAGDSTTHSVGTVRFGPDGALYVSNGDATSYNQVDPRTYRVQDIDNLSGKILRIDPITGEGLTDNPFYNGDPNSNRSKVYQYGLRNAFRFTIDPQTGKIYIGEVGWTQWEEINTGGPGTNYGWPYYEGGSGVNLPTTGYKDLPQSQTFYASGQTTTPAIYALNHGTTGINAIVMGDLYTGTAYPEQYWGDLFFNDLGQGIVRNLSFDSLGNVTSVETFTMNAQYVVQMNMGSDGNLYFVDLNDGLIGRWRFA